MLCYRRQPTADATGWGPWGVSGVCSGPGNYWARPGRRGACGPGPALKFKLLPRGLIALLQNRICRAVHLWCLGARLGYRGESPREGCCGSHAWVRLVDTGSSRNRVHGPDGMQLVFNASKMKILEGILLVRLLRCC